MDKTSQKGLWGLCYRPLYFSVNLQFFRHRILKLHYLFVDLRRWRYQWMRTHFAVMLIHSPLKSHVEGEVSCRTQGFNTRVDLLQMAAKRFLPLVNAGKDLIIRQFVFWFCLNSALFV